MPRLWSSGGIGLAFFWKFIDLAQQAIGNEKNGLVSENTEYMV